MQRDKEEQDPCYGCMYRADLRYSWICNYIEIVGHMRPCPIGEGCIVKKKRSDSHISKMRNLWVKGGKYL